MCYLECHKSRYLGLCSSYYSSTIYQSQLNAMPDYSQMTACCFDQYEIIGIHRSCRTTSTQWKNGRIDGRWPCIQKSVWWYEFPTSVNLSTLGIPSTDTCSSKYLGVTISKDLRWDDHINTITAKANRTLRRNMRGCKSSARTAAYQGLVRPTWNMPAQHGTHGTQETSNKSRKYKDGQSDL